MHIKDNMRTTDLLAEMAKGLDDPSQIAPLPDDASADQKQMEMDRLMVARVENTFPGSIVSPGFDDAGKRIYRVKLVRVFEVSDAGAVELKGG